MEQVHRESSGKSIVLDLVGLHDHCRDMEAEYFAA